MMIRLLSLHWSSLFQQKKYVVLGFLVMLCADVPARQRILVDTLKTSPFPLSWNTVDNYDPMGKPYYLVTSDGKAYADDDKSKFLPSLPFKLPAPGDFEYAGTPTWHKVKNGYLVAYDYGEWGGGLYWFSSDGKKHYKISGTQVQQFVVRNKEVFALTDGAHQGMPMGRIGKIVFKNDKWAIEPFLRTNTISHSITVRGSDLFLIAQQGIFRINDKNVIDTLLVTPIWQRTNIYNTSVILSNNKLYMGMWEGVYRYDLESGKQDWFSIK